MQQQAFVSDTDDSQPERIQKSVAISVHRTSFIGVVDRSIQFHDEPFLVAVEVNDAVTDLMLATELEAKEPSVPEQFPRKVFRRSWPLPHLPCPFQQRCKFIPTPVIFLEGKDMILGQAIRQGARQETIDEFAKRIDVQLRKNGKETYEELDNIVKDMREQYSDKKK